MPSSESQPNRMLERVSAILDAIDVSPGTASDLARRTGMSVSTVHRLALSMVTYDFLERRSDSVFELGRRFRRGQLAEVAQPVLEQLRDESKETVQLWTRRGWERICLCSADSPQELRAALPVGAHLGLPDGSAGRLLAGEEDALDSVEQHGWVESVGRRTPGLGSVSAPVRREGAVVAAVCLAMPLARLFRDATPGSTYGERVVEAAAKIQEQMELGAV